MTAFADYARYYDLIYQDKDYAAEAAFVMSRLEAAGCRPSRILELGCGTGRHAAELERSGCTVHGVDGSERMIGIARDRLQSPRLKFETGNIQTWRTDERFDAVLSLFHVMSYLTDYSELAAAIETAYVHLEPNGMFLFDFWYGPGVLADPPSIRVKRMSDGNIEVLRSAQPAHYPSENRVIVDFDIRVSDKQGRTISQFQERHPVRYWFLPELETMLKKGGFTMEHSGHWLSTRPLTTESWYGYVVARKTNAKD